MNGASVKSRVQTALQNQISNLLNKYTEGTCWSYINLTFSLSYNSGSIFSVLLSLLTGGTNLLF